MYQFCDGYPVSEMEPFGLGAVGDNLRGGSWLGRLAEGFGFNVDLGGDQIEAQTISAEQIARGIIGVATGGLYEPALGLIAGQRTLTGTPLTGVGLPSN